MSELTDSNTTTQPESVDNTERALQLLSIIAQTLNRIEATLTTGQASSTNRHQQANILPFNAGGPR
jgi:hypothetical protein